MSPILRVAPLVVLLLTTACVPTSAKSLGASGDPTAAASSPRESGVETVVASAMTKRGLMEIVDRGDGSREIVYRDPPSDKVLRAKRTPSIDQLLDVLAAKGRAAKRALVVGLGTGKLSTDLVKAGLEVDVLERDAELARLVCGYFECRANIVVDETPEALLEGRHTNPKLKKSSVYDAIVFDDELSTVPHAMHPIAETFAGVNLAPGAFRAVRSVHERMYAPTEGDLLPWLMLHGERDDGALDAIEIFSDPNATFSGRNARVWPLHDALTIAKGQTASSKQARIFGYLVARKDRSLTVELPHDRAGRLVVRLQGAIAHDKLSLTAAQAISFDEELRGSPQATAFRMIGSGHGHAEGRKLDASPVVVALTGTMSFAGLARVSGTNDDGYTYDLDVTRIDRVIGNADIESLRARIAPHFDVAAAMVSRGDYANAGRELDAVISELTTFFAEDAARVAWIDTLKSLSGRLATATKSGLAPECAELAYYTRLDHYPARPGLDPSEIRFQRALKKRLEAETLAAARKSADTRGLGAARCYWRSTLSDPNFPQASHFELQRRHPDAPVHDP